MTSPALPLAPPQQPSPVPRPRRLGGPYRCGRPSRRVVNGRREWLRRLTQAGRLEEAAAYAARYRLAPAPAAPAPAPAACPPAAPASPALVADALASLPAGGEGVTPPPAPNNCDISAPAPQNLQLGAVEVGEGLAVAALADEGGGGGTGGEVGSGAGGLPCSGGEASLQAPISSFGVGQVLTSDISVVDQWGNLPNLGVGVKLGVVGQRCRNKWYVEVQVDGRWTKAEVGGWVLHPQDRVMVELVWTSADGRDDEWRIVGKLAYPAPRPDPALETKVAAETGEVATEDVKVATEDELTHPAAEDFMERARREAYAAYNR